MVSNKRLETKRSKSPPPSLDTLISIAAGINSRIRQEGPMVLAMTRIRRSIKMKSETSSVAHEMVKSGDKNAIFWLMHEPRLLRIKNAEGVSVRDLMGKGAKGIPYSGPSWVFGDKRKIKAQGQMLRRSRPFVSEPEEILRT